MVQKIDDWTLVLGFDSSKVTKGINDIQKALNKLKMPSLGGGGGRGGGSGGGGNATFTITNVDIPDTKERGCCVYVGAGGNMTVVMESGSSIQFTGLSSGTFLPILVKRVRAATATDLIALY